jgi:hypothetical protein
MDLNGWKLYATLLVESLLFAGAYLVVTTPPALLGARAAVPFRVKKEYDWLAEYAKRPGWFMGLALIHVFLSLSLASAWAALVALQTHLLMEPPRWGPGWVYVVFAITMYVAPLNALNPKTWKRAPSAFTGLVRWLGGTVLVVHLIWPSTINSCWGWLLRPIAGVIEGLRTRWPWLPQY